MGVFLCHTISLHSWVVAIPNLNLLDTTISLELSARSLLSRNRVKLKEKKKKTDESSFYPLYCYCLKLTLTSSLSTFPSPFKPWSENHLKKTFKTFDKRLFCPWQVSICRMVTCPNTLLNSCTHPTPLPPDSTLGRILHTVTHFALGGNVLVG